MSYIITGANNGHAMRQEYACDVSNVYYIYIYIYICMCVRTITSGLYSFRPTESIRKRYPFVLAARTRTKTKQHMQLRTELQARKTRPIGLAKLLPCTRLRVARTQTKQKQKCEQLMPCRHAATTCCAHPALVSREAQTYLDGYKSNKTTKGKRLMFTDHQTSANPRASRPRHAAALRRWFVLTCVFTC